MQLTIDVDNEKIMYLIKDMSIDYKLKIYDMIKGEILKTRFKNIMDTLQTDDLTLEEIEKEVSSVREDRYANRG